MKHIPTANELTGVQSEVYELCLHNQKATDSNTELCIDFWLSKMYDLLPDDCTCSPTEIELIKAIRKYPPESLTKYRRNLVEWGLIFPSEKSKKHSREKEAENHKKDYQFSFHNETMDALKKLTILPDEHGQNQLFKTFNKLS